MKFKQIIFSLFILVVLFSSCSNTQVLEQQISNLQQQLDSTNTVLDNATFAVEDGSFVHVVLVWLKEDISVEDREKFVVEMEKLEDIESIKEFRLGTAADSEARPIVDQSYDYAMFIHFDDLGGHDAYQIDPIHKDFVAQNAALWTKVLVYDVETEE